MVDRATGGGTGRNHFARLWAERNLGRLVFRDMLVNGTILNLVVSAAALLLLAAGLPVGGAMALHLAPLPYNIFLAICVWRAAEGRAGLLPALARPLAAGWAVATVAI